MNSPKPSNERSYLLAIALLLLSGVCLYYFFLPEKPAAVKSSLSPQKSKEFEAQVNRHLFKTSQSMEISRQKMKVDTFDLSERGLRPLPTPAVDAGFDLSGDPRNESLTRDLGRDVRENSEPRNPNELVQTELFQQEQLENYSEEYKREYARQFVENAKKAGYHIILNDQYKVIRVNPIRKPAENFPLFPPNSGAAH